VESSKRVLCVANCITRSVSLMTTLLAINWLLPLRVALAGDVDLAHAEQLVREHHYQDAYELLVPAEQAMASDPRFNYLLGRAALGSNRAEAAVQHLERAKESRPDSVATRLALGRAYYEVGRIADAKIEFETVLHFDDLPADLASQTRAYADAAEHHLDEDDPLVGFEAIEAGAGRYRVRSTSDTGEPEPSQRFYLVDAAVDLSYILSDRYTLEGDLGYRGRLFEGSGTRNDSDLNLRVGGRRMFGDSNVGFGFRGQVSYVGEGDYRYDYGAFLDWNRELQRGDEVSADTYIRRRQYPTGPLRDRSRSIAELSLGWLHSLLDGRASVSAGVHGGYQFATARPDGNSGFYGANVKADYTFSDQLGAFASGLWEWNQYNTDTVHFHPDSLDEAWILRRRDSLYEIAAGVGWEFARGWTLQPEALYVHDSSNVDVFHYSSTEFWASVRKAF